MKVDKKWAGGRRGVAAGRIQTRVPVDVQAHSWSAMLPLAPQLPPPLSPWELFDLSFWIINIIIFWGSSAYRANRHWQVFGGSGAYVPSPLPPSGTGMVKLRPGNPMGPDSPGIRVFCSFGYTQSSPQEPGLKDHPVHMPLKVPTHHLALHVQLLQAQSSDSLWLPCHWANQSFLGTNTTGEAHGPSDGSITPHCLHLFEALFCSQLLRMCWAPHTLTNRGYVTSVYIVRTNWDWLPLLGWSSGTGDKEVV